MCGIFGLVVGRDHNISEAAWSAAIKELFKLSETRGREAAGLAISTGDVISVTKDSVSASSMMRTRDFERMMETAKHWFKTDRESALASIGHSRLVTNGLQGIDANNQPVWRDDVVLIHNGIVVNVDELWERERSNGLFPRAEVDTEVIAALMTRYRAEGATPAAAISSTFGDIYGETSIAAFLNDTNALYLATNTGSLYVVTNAAKDALFFASEEAICKELMAGKSAIPGFHDATITQVRPGIGRVIDLGSLEQHSFNMNLVQSQPLPEYAPKLATQKRIEEKSALYEQARAEIKRCTKCLLPETMPYIEFDSSGVCNYCHSHQHWEKRPEQDLQEFLARYRSKDGSPDCVVAFSGGRDSSYGLHMLKTRYGMTPLTFSYDWGMVTDLARRNQARMCGKLGVEHIWISADIKKKRKNIQRNVAAWLKKPDLGLIPLFTAGDKQFFWYAAKTIKATGLNLSVFCTNRLEKTDFKTGFLGVPPQDVKMLNTPSTTPILQKANIFWQYGSRFISNPHYLNPSLPDTMFAAFSYYGMEQDHLFMFDYLPWDESTINDTLISEYDWEIAPDSPSTWRIGDGTQPWYNYIFYTVAGFTEFDTFRSNQIREGMLTRDEALETLPDVNEPRWEAIREYSALINLDFDEMIRVVDRMPKLYYDS